MNTLYLDKSSNDSEITSYALPPNENKILAVGTSGSKGFMLDIDTRNGQITKTIPNDLPLDAIEKNGRFLLTQNSLLYYNLSTLDIAATSTLDFYLLEYNMNTGSVLVVAQKHDDDSSYSLMEFSATPPFTLKNTQIIAAGNNFNITSLTSNESVFYFSGINNDSQSFIQKYGSDTPFVKMDTGFNILNIFISDSEKLMYACGSYYNNMTGQPAGIILPFYTTFTVPSLTQGKTVFVSNLKNHLLQNMTPDGAMLLHDVQNHTYSIYNSLNKQYIVFDASVMNSMSFMKDTNGNLYVAGYVYIQNSTPATIIQVTKGSVFNTTSARFDPGTALVPTHFHPGNDTDHIHPGNDGAKKNWLFIVVVAVFLLLLAGSVAYFLYYRKQKKQLKFRYRKHH
jgi:hypothetical protein